MKRFLPVFMFVALLSACADRSAYEGSPMAPALTVPGTLLPSDPDDISLANTGGKLTLLSFGFTECPDICPTTLSDWRRARRQLDADTSRVRFIFVSVDHRKDTPATAAAFARNFDPTFIGVAPDSTKLKTLLPFFQAEAVYSPAASGHGSEVGHTTHSFLIDAKGRISLVYTFATQPEPIARDIKRMLAKGEAK
jgi:protein SCO1/2